MKPEPHGIDDKFILRPQLAKQLKINAFFTTMPATTWRMMHDMVANHVKYEEGLSGAEESYKMFKTAFQAIGEKSTYKALATYCKSLSAYYVSIKIIAAYEHEVKEYDAQQEALRLHDLYKNGVSLGAEEINRMSSCLSCLLDLVDNSDDGQRSLFSNEQWEFLKAKFTGCRKVNSLLKPVIIDTWKLAAKYAEIDGSFIRSKDIDIYEDNPKICDKSFSSKLTEGDFASVVWSPVIRKILAIRKIIRLKFGESVNSDSTKSKQLQYEDDSNVIGPKVDMRFVLDLNGAEVDVGAVECARALPSEDKLHHDETKLLKEGKDVVDGVINRLHEVDLERVQGRIMQTAGLYGEISCVTLSAPGLYVARHVHKVKMPSDLHLLSPLIDTLLNLIETIQVMEDMALLIKQSEEFFADRRSSFGLKFGRAMGLIRMKNSYQSWLRDTYYFPAKGTRRNSMLPNDFSAIVEPYIDDVDSTHDDGRIPIVDDVDEDGWALLENGRYYNSLIDVYSDEKPT